MPYGLEAVILNSCYSAEKSSAIADSVNSVIAMKGNLKEAAAIAFTRSFYDALGQGLELEEAFSWGVAGAKFNHLLMPWTLS